MNESVKCTKHSNCKVYKGSHMMTLVSEITTIDLRSGAITTRNLLDHTPEALSNNKSPKLATGTDANDGVSDLIGEVTE